ncbi:exodeoxyribonuclease VII large subunit [Parapedobacter sp. ISTM3]|uniref:Exodeoxyribonuclease 7 large subunit n=1 Tax=Parapedobacter luteus TaxID=623280 RepID=A0A1T5D2W3_9SPHI|nr:MULTISPECIES: exodeoxyribonuclease VII large subunit [Parapedobacter]MBK1440510.1 exodeoxyribonuclease VII large subunit [Parapedobacter sp. ISTM3]SKB66042.1 exodeoxyribonuclease VII large subunit [Parapedobacter luteus]
MPEKLPDKTVFSLVEVARSIQKTIAERYKSVYWIKAEMNKLNHYSHSGHCYPELVEKKDGKVIAEMRSVLWNGDYKRINERFIEIAKEPLKNGITILFQATISYDPLYGLSLRILDIDPAYALGELEREKQENIQRLRHEELFYANKQLPFPPIPKRLAVISVETSKGYADFVKILNGNSWGYRFEQTLFPALLQGDKAVPSIINQLVRIAEHVEEYDVVAIIRGGGGDVGLSSYNNYLLASAIARFPIPVLTGIGHSTNQTVSEMVAYQNAITPSELADFLIQRFHNFAVPVSHAQDAIEQAAAKLFATQKSNLMNCIHHFRLHSVHLLNQQHRALEYHAMRLDMASVSRLRHENQALLYPQQALLSTSLATLKNNKFNLAAMQKSVQLLDPQQVLNRGYSITRINGRAVKHTENIRDGDTLETHLASGSLSSVVIQINPSANE